MSQRRLEGGSERSKGSQAGRRAETAANRAPEGAPHGRPRRIARPLSLGSRVFVFRLTRVFRLLMFALSADETEAG